MIPVVNHQYRYLLFYSAKVACTHLRELYLALHSDEMTVAERAQLDEYHNLNEVFPIDWNRDYSEYERFVITRNPYPRIVSAFLDQYVYQRGEAVQAMLNGYEPTSFIDFLRALRAIPDEQRDAHFQTQSFLTPTLQLVTRRTLRYRLLGRRKAHEFPIDHCYDVSRMKSGLSTVYRTIFANAPEQLTAFMRLQDNAKGKRNSLLYSSENIADAAELSVEVLDEMMFAPKPEAFLRRDEVRALVFEIYEHDFKHFGYPKNRIPITKHLATPAHIPPGFDWKLYLEFNPDVANSPFVRNRRSALRHYLEFSPYDDYERAYNLETPADFDWQRYLALHADLPAAGILDRDAALRHYQTFGRREKRALR